MLMVLWGRADEQLVIDQLLVDARNGRSRTLVIRGEPGIGKSALLRYAADNASDMHLLRASGAETEAEFAFSGLHMLLRPVLDRIGGLPPPQAAALRRAFAMDSEGVDDQFLVGLAVLSLLSDLSETAPVLCLIDDAHWLDTESLLALLFAARRLQSEGIVLLGAARTVRRAFHGPAPPELTLNALDQADAARLVDEQATGLPPGLRARVLAEAKGNPLALIELAAHAGAAPIDGLEPLPAAGDMFAAQLGRIGTPALTVLLLAAAEPAGDLALIVRAARCTGADPHEVDRAELAGLVTLTTDRLEFRHPLIRSAVYHGASMADRRAAHRALAEALACGDADVYDHRAWHIAAATVGWDESAAAMLQGAAERSLKRGGYVAAAAAYERAASLSPSPEERAGRLLAAATAANDGGDVYRAIRLLDELDQVGGDDLLRARVVLLRAHLPTLDRPDHIASLIAGAERIRDRAPDLAVTMLVHAAAQASTHLFQEPAITAANLLRRLLAARQKQADPLHAAVAQHALLFARRTESRRDIADFVTIAKSRPARMDPMERLIASEMAFTAGDHHALAEISAALVADCRSEGMVGWLVGALEYLALGQIICGQWDSGRTSALEGLQLATDTGQGLRVSVIAALLGWLSAQAGDEEGFRSWMEQVPSDTTGAKLWFNAGRAQLDLATGSFGSALDHLEELARMLGPSAVFLYQPDLVEAAVRTGHDERAREEADRFAAWAEGSGQRWARAVAHRCLALVTGDEPQFAEAFRLHEGAGHPFEAARTGLLYGEWLRRQRRRADARTQLAAARDVFMGLGADGYSERAGAELTATGATFEQHGRRRPAPLSRLTAQEAQVVSLAARGLSNRDIAARLFLSPRTVGHHLYKAYPKLGVGSRAELREKISNDD